MAKDNEKVYNGSYLYRLNEELSGQAQIAPYFSSIAEDGVSAGSSPEVEEAIITQGSADPEEEVSRGEYERLE